VEAKEFEFAEIAVDRLFLESIANEQSPYYSTETEQLLHVDLNKLRRKLKWHINHSLSQRQKEVIRFYLIGKTERQIAAILGITQQVVNIYKHRAIRKLHKMLVAGGVCQKTTR